MDNQWINLNGYYLYTCTISTVNVLVTYFLIKINFNGDTLLKWVNRYD